MAHQNPQSSASRAAILHACMEEMCQNGFDGARVQAIARRAGVSPSLVMKHFGTKRRLAAEAITGFIEDFAQAFDACAARSGDFAAHTAEMFGLFRRYRPQWKLLLSVMLVPAHEDLCGRFMPQYLGLTRKVNRAFFAAEVDEADLDEFSYVIVALHLAYVVGGSAENCQSAKEKVLARFLRGGENNTTDGEDKP